MTRWEATSMTSELYVVARIDALQQEAYVKGMEVDWEAGKVVPYPTDVPPAPWEYGDNNAKDPEQNWDEDW